MSLLSSMSNTNLITVSPCPAVRFGRDFCVYHEPGTYYTIGTPKLYYVTLQNFHVLHSRLRNTNFRRFCNTTPDFFVSLQRITKVLKIWRKQNSFPFVFLSVC